MSPGCQCELWPAVSCNEVTAGSPNTHFTTSNGHTHRYAADRGDTITPDPSACSCVFVHVVSGSWQPQHLQ